jgi:glycosyltransferase involved in cell wall biosynthesis
MVIREDVNDLPMSPVVSVCVPLYNSSSTIARCLRSILDQDGVAFEILVVDDDSDDDGAAIAATMLRPGDRLVRNASRLGLNENHNKCLALARGSCIQFVHGDDWLLPGALQRLSRYFDDPMVGLAFAPRRVVGDDLEWQRQYGTLYKNFWKLREHNHGSWLVTQMLLRGRALYNWIGEPTNIMFRRQLALDIGGFRADIYLLVDLDLWLRLMLRSEVCFVSQELSVRNHTGSTETQRILATRRWWLDQLRILTWAIIDPSSPTITRLVAGMWWLPAWLRLWRELAVYGPDRRPRLKTLSLAPFREFTHARQLRRSISALPAV